MIFIKYLLEKRSDWQVVANNARKIEENAGLPLVLSVESVCHQTHKIRPHWPPPPARGCNSGRSNLIRIDYKKGHVRPGLCTK